MGEDVTIFRNFRDAGSRAHGDVRTRVPADLVAFNLSRQPTEIAPCCLGTVQEQDPIELDYFLTRIWVTRGTSLSIEAIVERTIGLG